MGIIEAAQKAADVTGASVKSIHRWAKMYFTCMIGTTAEEMDDMAVEGNLALLRERQGYKKPTKSDS